jgi:transglutaminase-like putative cysteine protease
MGPTTLLDLEDPRLRLRAQALTQLCKSEREKALACYAFVKRLPYTKPLKLHLRSARQVLDAGRGDSPDKATLLVALLRLAGIPARLHYVELRGEVGRGLTGGMSSSSRPVVEAWLQGRWVATDTYIFDAAYMAGARQRLRDLDWERGFGIHRDGHAIWNGVDDAWVGGQPLALDPMVLADLGHWHDPRAYAESPAFGSRHGRLVRALHWNLIAPVMQRVIHDVREGTQPGTPAPRRKPS